MQSMGFYGAVLVLLNYLLLITLTPAAFAVMETYQVAPTRCCICCRRRRGPPPRGFPAEQEAQSTASTGDDAGNSHFDGAAEMVAENDAAGHDETPWILRR